MNILVVLQKNSLKMEANNITNKFAQPLAPH